MSSIQQMMLAGRGQVTVTGSLTGSGSLAIPAGVTSITLTGAGGPGTALTNYYGWTLTWVNNPTSGGNIVGSATMYFSGPNTPSASSSGYEYQLPPSFRFEIFGTPYTPNATATRQGASSPNYNWITDDQSIGSYLTYEWKFRSNTPATPGAETTASIQSKNIYFPGASTGITTPPSPTVQTFTGLSGAASSMSYSVPSGGSLSYSYTY